MSLLYQSPKSVPKNASGTSGGDVVTDNFEASGVVPIAIENNKVYMYLAFDPNKGFWNYFGGGREGTETYIKTVHRELIEECCPYLGKDKYSNECLLPIRSVIMPKIKSGDVLCIPKYNDRAQKWNNFFFVSMDKRKLVNKYVSNIKGNEVTEVKWFDVDDIDWKDSNLTSWTQPKSGLVPPIHPPLSAIMRDHKYQIENYIRTNI